jgi:putative spermidine/putrescine transport system ATP-binding protein
MTTIPAEAAIDDLRPVSGAHLEIGAVTKLYGSKPAVDDVSLDIRPGEFVTLLGASGSGKTTLLRIIAGFLDASSGSMRLDDQELSRVPVHKRNIGMVFQNYALFPHMSVERNVAYPLARRRVPRAERAQSVAEALAAVELTGFEKRSPRDLSGGQQQRVALARAIVAKPRLLLMDEPLGALDRRLREALQLQIRRLSHELGVTVVNVTHDQEEALTMSDRIALLSGGRLMQFGTPRELFENPASEVVARFLGESNIFEPAAGNAGRAAAGKVFVRPHHMEVADRPSGREGYSHATGRVQELIYAGDTVKVIAQTPSGQQLLARVAPETGDRFQPGDGMVFEWPDRSSILLGA